MNGFRNTLIGLISRYLKRVNIPAALYEISKVPEKHTIITQSDSIIIESLLCSFAKRLGLKGVRHCSVYPPETRDANYLYWQGMPDNGSDHFSNNEPQEQLYSTLSVFHVKGPIRDYPQHKLTARGLIGLLVIRSSLLVVMGAPFPASHHGIGDRRRLLRQLKLDFYRNLKLVRGTPFQSIEAQMRVVLGGSEFEREIKVLAQRLGTTPWALRRRAESSFYEMAANPRRPMYGLIAWVGRFVLDRLFTQVITTGLEHLIPAVKENTVILVPMHRSHLDYILVGCELYRSNLNPPIVAAGVNLSFWPIGFLIRSVGGYFVKRNARSDRLHAILLKRYVTYLIKRGHLQEFFIEGGRSRSGKMLSPKVGLLGIMLSAYLKGARKDILFVPVSINYENVVEDLVFGEENTGRSKKEESLLGLVKARKIFRKKYGEVMVNFGRPIALSSYVRSANLTNLAGKLDERALVYELGLSITRNLRTQINTSFTSLAFTALMMAPRYGLSRTNLVTTIHNLARIVTILKKHNPAVGSFTPSLDAFLNGRESIVNDLERGGIVNRGQVGDQEVFYIPGRKRYTADFYRNFTIHFFLPLGFLSIAQLLDEEVKIERVLSLYELLKHDFLLPETNVFSAETSALIEVLKNEQILVSRQNRTYFVDNANGIFIPALLSGPLQTHLWVLLNLRAKGEGTSSSNISTTTLKELRTFDYQNFLQKLQTDFSNAVYLGMMNRTEAASKTSLVSALESLSAREVIALHEVGGVRHGIAVLKENGSEIALLEKTLHAILQWQIQQANALVE